MPSDRVGRLFGSWIVTGDAEDPRRVAVRCDCGTETELYYGELARGRSKHCQSCGQVKHGMTGTRAYRTWMNLRCRKGDAVDRWEDFEVFLADVGHPKAAQRLHRDDPDRPFGPGNAHWLDETEARRICTERSLESRAPIGPMQQLGRNQRAILSVLKRSGRLRLCVLSGLVGRPSNNVASSLAGLKSRGLVRKRKGGWELDPAGVREAMAA